MYSKDQNAFSFQNAGAKNNYINQWKSSYGLKKKKFFFFF